LAAENPQNPSRKLHYSIAIPPLTRTILDSLFTVVFVFHDLPTMSAWYHKSGWRDLQKECLRFEDQQGTDPGQARWLGELKSYVDKIETLANINAEERSNPSKINWWPNPGKMKKHKGLSTARRDYLCYLNDWYYGEQSAMSHLSLPGALKRTGFFFMDDDQNRESVLENFRSYWVLTTIIVVLALLSEIDAELEFGLAEELKYVWCIVNAHWEVAKELYEFRYAQLL
jgi:hypothetical protein